MRSGQWAVGSGQLLVAACGFALVAPIYAADADTIVRTGTTATPAGSSIGSLQVGLALIGVLALIAILKWGAGRFFGVGAKAKGTSSIKIISRSAVGPKQSIMLVQIGRRVVLVGDSGSQMNALSEITDADEVAELVGASGRKKVEEETEFAGVIETAREDFAAVDSPAQDADVEKMQEDLTGLSERIRGLSRAFQKA